MNQKIGRMVGIFILVAVLTITRFPVSAQGPEPVLVYQEDFADEQAQGWTLPPAWVIMEDEGNYVLAGKEHEWAISNQVYDDYRLSFKIKVLQGSVHLVYRMNAEGRYFIAFDPDGSRLSKQIWPDTFEHNLAERFRSHALQSWHQVEIIGQEALIQFFVDGVLEWEYTDPTPLLDGGYAFESLDDSHIYIDDVAVRLNPDSPYVPVPADAFTASLTWMRTGGPLGGLGYDVRMNPQAPEQMLVTDAFAGVFRSSDGGVRWVPSNEGITTRTGQTGDSIPIFCLTIDPNDPNIIWTGTQNTRGIFKSVDGGLTWEERVNGIQERDGITFRGFTVDPENSDVVYAAGELASYLWNQGEGKHGREFDMTQGVVYKTVDGGLNWTEIWRGENLARYIWIDPRDTRVLYVSTGLFDREAANSDPVKGLAGGEGVLKSTDGGATWVHINNGLNNLYVGSLFMHPANPDTLLAAAGNVTYHQDGGVYLTQNGGETWTQVVHDDLTTVVEYHPADPSIAYAASRTAIYRSSDGGVTWELASGGPTQGWGPTGVDAGFPIDLQVDPRNPDRLFVNAYGGGNFLSEDGGLTWVDASRGYTGAQIRALAVDPNQPAHVFAAGRSGIFSSGDGGDQWEGIAFHPVRFTEWNAIAVHPENPDHLIAATNAGSRLVTSFDGGRQWQTTLEMEGKNIGWGSIVFAPSSPEVVYAGSAGYYSAGAFDHEVPGIGIYVSPDGGQTWSPANDGISQDAHVTSLSVDPQDHRVVYAATANHGLLKTTDGGSHWQRLQGGLPDGAALSVAVNPADPNLVFAGFDRNVLFISKDGGATWERSVRGLMAEGMYTSIVFDPVDPLHAVYLADFSRGVLRSSDSGNTWQLINTGLTTRSVSALAISADGMHLYAGSDGGGVFRLDLYGEPPEAYILQSTPTPAPQATSIPPTISETAPPVATTPPAASSPARLPCGSAALLPLVALCLPRLLRRKDVIGIK